MSDADRAAGPLSGDPPQAGHLVILSSGHPVHAVSEKAPSPVRAWCYLVWLSLQRLARAQQMVWIALILLAFTATVVAPVSAGNRWDTTQWRDPRRIGPTYQEYSQALQETRQALPWSPPAAALQDSINLASQSLLERSGFFVFSNWIVFSVFLSF